MTSGALPSYAGRARSSRRGRCAGSAATLQGKRRESADVKSPGLGTLIHECLFPGVALPSPRPLRAAQVACALFGIAAIDMKHGAMMRSYAWLVAYLLILDVVWHHFWAERLLRNYTGVREAQEMWWGLMVANTNKVCGFGMELATAIMRLCSLPVWFLLWHNGHLEGNAQVGFQGYSSLEHLKHSGGSTL